MSSIPGLFHGAPLTSSDRVRQIEVPAAARAHCTLARIDYEDAFLLDTGASRARTPEEWARVTLEEAPAAVRTALVSGWSSLGLQLDLRRSAASVLGWQVRESTAGHVLLAAGSRVGMPGELLFKRHDGALLLCTFVEHDSAAARAMWAGVERVHISTVRYVLEQASRRNDP